MNTTTVTEAQYQQFFDSVSKYKPSSTALNAYWRSKLKSIKTDESTVLLQKGEVYKKFWFVLSGILSDHTLMNGKESLLYLYQKNQFMIQMYSFNFQVPSEHTIIASAGTHVLEMNYDDLQEMYSTVEGSGCQMLGIMARDVIKLEHQKMITMKPRARIVELYHQYPDLKEAGQTLLTKKEIADHLNIKQKYFNSLHKQIQAKGLLN